MSSVRFVFLMFVVSVVVAAILAAGASALPQVLPETAGKNAATISGETAFETLAGKIVKCQKSTGTSEETGVTPLGPFHMTFKECASKAGGITFKCTGLGDAAGELLVLGEYHLVYDELTPALGVAILFSLSPVHFECAGGFALGKLEGSELCLITEPSVAKTLHIVVCSETAGEPTDNTYWNDEGKEVHQGIKSTENEGAAESSAQKGTGLILWLTSAHANVSVAIMS